MKAEKEKEKLPTTMRILYREKKVAIYFWITTDHE